MNKENMIEITGADLGVFIKKAYTLSKPQGMGFLHYEASDLPEEDVQEIIHRNDKSSRIAVSMDYVKGRYVKMTIFKEGERIFINKEWFDHTQQQLDDLLNSIGIITA